LWVSDAPLRIYENVLFADNYYQEFGGYPHGQLMASSYNRRLTALPGGYSSAHSDMHLWYHATIDLVNPADDTEALLQGNDRAIWFSPYEEGGARAGFHYSRIGGGDRVSLDQPAGPGTDHPADGYNQRWDLGAGASPNRTSLPSNHGNWPNLIRVHLAGTNSMAQGETNELTFLYQWAKPATSNALVSVHLDGDFNPFNGNERLVGQWTAPGTTSNNVGIASVSLNVAATNSTPGVHSVYAKIAAGGRTRYLYAPELLTVFSSVQPPSLAIAQVSGSGILIDVSGIPGQRIVLESTADLHTWQPLATNVLTTSHWTYLDNSGSQAAAQRFFRAALR
jgi:hypothetical protein